MDWEDDDTLENLLKEEEIKQQSHEANKDKEKGTVELSKLKDTEPSSVKDANAPKFVHFQDSYENEDASPSILKTQSKSSLMNSLFSNDSLEDTGLKHKNSRKGNESELSFRKKSSPEDDWLGIQDNSHYEPNPKNKTSRKKESSPLDVFLMDHDFALQAAPEEKLEKADAKVSNAIELQKSATFSPKPSSAPPVQKKTFSRSNGAISPPTSNKPLMEKSFTTNSSPSFVSLSDILDAVKPTESQQSVQRAPSLVDTLDTLLGRTHDKNQAKDAESLPLHPNGLTGNEKPVKKKSSAKVQQSKETLLRRKEELIKEEMLYLQEDYEHRMQKLKNELNSTNDNLLPKKLDQNISQIMSDLEKVASQLDSLKISTEPSSYSSTQLEQDLKTILKDSLSSTIEQNFRKLINGMEMAVVTKLSEVVTNEMKRQNLGGFEILLKELCDSQKNSTDQILSVQNQLKTNILESMNESLKKLIEHENQSNIYAKEKTAVRLKELRKGLRQLYLQLDEKSSLVYRSQQSVEVEQRSIAQSIREINSAIKITHPLNYSQQFHPHDSTISSMQIQANIQHEMELKLLKEERKSLSESIEQVNVDRRKLNNEKLHLEQELLNFEREKIRIKEIESISKSRLAEAKELKREAEKLAKQEGELRSEAGSKLDKLTREKTNLRNQIHDLEQEICMREQKLFFEKAELMREKEFLDKLRAQSLCPGCLKSGSRSMASPRNIMRTSGDGGGDLQSSNSKISQFLTPEEKAYLYQ